MIDSLWVGVALCFSFAGGFVLGHFDSLVRQRKRNEAMMKKFEDTMQAQHNGGLEPCIEPLPPHHSPNYLDYSWPVSVSSLSTRKHLRNAK